jgi:hypothetical protein
MRNLRMLCLVALSVCCLPGCKVEYTEPVVPPRALSAAEEDFEALWQASRETLRKYHFKLDRQDRRHGIIDTEWMTGMHFFEFWRKDAARPADFGESTIQTIYRKAKVTLSPAEEDPTTYKAKVQVLLRRSDKPTGNVTSTSEALSLFRSGRRRRPRTLLLESDRPEVSEAEYVELGQDRSLEARLTADIAAAADRRRGR